MSSELNPNLKPELPKRKAYVRTVGPRLRAVFLFVLGLVSILGANSAYLVAITFLEWQTKATYQNYFYQLMFLAHLVLGLVLVVPFVIFGVGHTLKAYNRPNRRAVKVGYPGRCRCDYSKQHYF